MAMDDLGRELRTRWNELARARIPYARPWLDLTPELAAARVTSCMPAVGLASKRLLLLAGGGGQQSAAFALLGALVTVHDISEVQLQHDASALAHHGLAATLNEGDMRDLSRYGDGSFDIVIQRYSINYVPDVASVFAGVSRVLRLGGVYYLQWANPFNKSLEASSWTGAGYVLETPYTDGELAFTDARWRTGQEHLADEKRVLRPREFNHTLSCVVNALVRAKLNITALHEDDDGQGDSSARPGSVAHMLALTPPYLIVWAEKA